MEAHDYLASVTVRLPIDLIKDLDAVTGKGKKFKDRSDAIRTRLQLGGRVETIMELQKNPKRKKEFEQKFKHLVSKQNLEQTLETFDSDELDAAAFFISNLKKQKFQQELLTLNKY